MIWSIDIVLLLIITILAIVIIETRDLLEATMIFAGFSFLMAVIWVEMNSVDVAFTEAAVGAGISTVLMVAAIAHTIRHEE